MRITRTLYEAGRLLLLDDLLLVLLADGHEVARGRRRRVLEFGRGLLDGRRADDEDGRAEEHGGRGGHEALLLLLHDAVGDGARSSKKSVCERAVGCL